MFIKKVLPILLLHLVLMFIPVAASAQFVPCDGVDIPCTECHLLEMGNSILVWLIAILFVVFGFIAAAAGWGLITAGGNPQALTAAKSKLTNALIGIMIVLAAWLLVDTIMRQLLAGGNASLGDSYSGFGVWSEIQCGSMTPTVPGETVYVAGPTGASSAGVGPGCNPGTTNFPACATAGTPAAAAGVIVNSGNLGPSCNPGTTNFPACATAPSAVGTTVDTSNLSATCNPGTSNFPTCAEVSGTVGSRGSTATPLSISIDGSPSAVSNTVTVSPSVNYTINDPAMPEYGIDAGANHGNSITITSSRAEGGMVGVRDNDTGEAMMMGCALISPPLEGC